MEPLWALVAGVIALGIGLFLIEAYFTRKEKFVDNLKEKMKGKFDATF